MKNRSLLITINSINELTGGGIYARTVLSGLKLNYNEVLVIDKKLDGIDSQDDVAKISLKKHTAADLVSRVFLSPNYIFFYILKIIKVINRGGRFDEIYLHNSRLGIIALLLRLFTSSNIVGCFDNHESYLSFQQSRLTNNPFLKLFRLFDTVLLLLSEKLMIYSCHHLTFITEKDSRSYNSISDYSVLPVCIGKNNSRKEMREVGKKFDFLFTASFSFEPNIKALERVLELASVYPNYKFAIAGRNLSKIEINDCPVNVILLCSPSQCEMDDIFLSSQAYISLVEDGSGMKTKIAEALSFGLFVFSSSHSAIGYEEIYSSECLTIYSELISDFEHWALISSNFEPSKAYAVYEKHYAYDKAGAVIKGVLDEI